MGAEGGAGLREREGRTRGPAFCDKWGNVARSQEYEMALAERLQVVQNKQPGVIPVDVEMYEVFRVSWSFRQGAT